MRTQYAALLAKPDADFVWSLLSGRPTGLRPGAKLTNALLVPVAAFGPYRVAYDVGSSWSGQCGSTGVRQCLEWVRAAPVANSWWRLLRITALK